MIFTTATGIRREALNTILLLTDWNTVIIDSV